MEKQPSTLIRDHTPTIRSAISDPEARAHLLSAIEGFDVEQRLKFLSALASLEELLRLENERVTIAELLQALRPTGAGSLLSAALVYALIPEAIFGVPIGAAALTAAEAINLRNKKRDMISIARELRSAVVRDRIAQ